MPVIGHTFAGIVLAQEFEPAGDRAGVGFGPVARALWMPAVVGLSYLPDVVTQIGFWMGYRGAQSAGHSMPIGILAGLAIGLIWARLTGGPARVMAGVAAGSILLHDAFDLLQDAERMPLWPIASWHAGAEWLLFDDRLWGEIVVFGFAFVVYEAWRAIAPGRVRTRPAAAPKGAARWIGRALVFVVLASSLAVLGLRRERDREMREAVQFIRLGRFVAALEALDRADRWPMRPGSGDRYRGEAYERLGDAASAEAAYLRAYERNPDDFWNVASLAEFYASHGSAADRRTRAAPYVAALTSRFSTHEAYGRVMERIERTKGEGW